MDPQPLTMKPQGKKKSIHLRMSLQTRTPPMYIMNPATQETKRKMEVAIPNSLRWLLGWPEISSPTTESTGLRDAIQALLRKEKLGGYQKERLRLMNEELA